MKLRDRIQLIPRNNWDYRIIALLRALAGVKKSTSQAKALKELFRQDPIWTNSGRTSLYAILKALDLPAGAKVGVPLFCCSVVFEAICQAGLTPCFIDSGLDDYNLSVDDLRRRKGDLAALVVVHMFGNPCDMDAILEVAGAIPVIEDCAQSIFSTYQGKPTGLLSKVSFFSFRCGKYISAGEGSVIFCRDPELERKIRQVVDSFESWSTLAMFTDALSTFIKATLYNRPWYGLLGYPVGMRLDKKLNLTAKGGFETGQIASTHLTLIEARIPGFQEKIKIQSEHARQLLKSVPPDHFGLPSEGADRARNWFQFPLQFQTTHQRDAMAAYLFEQGIDTAKYLDDIASEASDHYGYQGDCPNAERLSKTVLLVPIHHTLRSTDMDRIAHAINEGAKKIQVEAGR